MTLPFVGALWGNPGRRMTSSFFKNMASSARDLGFGATEFVDLSILGGLKGLK